MSQTCTVHGATLISLCAYCTAMGGWLSYRWFDFLERQAQQRVPKRLHVALKIVADQAVNATISNVVYFSLIPWWVLHGCTGEAGLCVRLDKFRMYTASCVRRCILRIVL